MAVTTVDHDWTFMDKSRSTQVDAADLMNVEGRHPSCLSSSEHRMETSVVLFQIMGSGRSICISSTILPDGLTSI